jgi:alpha-beta hydrolase superfamily lysophospholipase
MTERASGMTQGKAQGKGGPIYTHTWEIDGARGGGVLVHGYGEHIGRYEHLAEALNDAGWSVYGLDHAGHGRSEGERVLIPDFTPVVEDVHTVVGQAQAANPGRPVAMVGHSMGGGIATRYVELHPGEVAALVLSAPAIGSLQGTMSLLGMDVIPPDPLPVTTLSCSATPRSPRRSTRAPDTRSSMRPTRMRYWPSPSTSSAAPPPRASPPAGDHPRQACGPG